MFRLLSFSAVVALVLAAASAEGASRPLPGRLVYSSNRAPNYGNGEIYSLSVSEPSSHDLTKNQGSDGGPSISPDGRRVAFWSERLKGGRLVRGLFVMRLDGSEKRLVTPPDLSVEGRWPATWSPDSRWLAFEGSRDLRLGVWLVRSDGFGLRLLVQGAQWPEWEPNGTRVAYFLSRGPEEDQTETVDVDTGARTVIGLGSSPAWSPDARSIAFVRQDRKTLAADLFVAPASGGSAVQLTHVDPDTWVGGPSWSPSGESIAFTVSTLMPASDVYTIGRDGSRLSRLSAGSGPSWSPSGAKIAFLTGHGVAVMRADGTDVRELRTKTVLDYVSDVPVWEHDGKRLLVTATSYRSQYDLFVSNGDGSGLHRVTHTRANEFLPTWSPARRRIAFVRATGMGRPSIWVSSSSGRHARRLHSGTYPSWSPSGKRLAFQLGDFIYTMTDRGSHTKNFALGTMPAWSPDGKSIAFLRDNALVVLDVRTHHARTLADLGCEIRGEGDDTVLQQPEWSPRSTMLAVTRTCDYGPSILQDAWVIDAADGSDRSIAAGAGSRSRLAWSPDGRWLAYTSEDYDARIRASRVFGGGTRRVSFSAGDDRDLDWR